MACTSRCRSAKTPRCTCECGGRNHGSSDQLRLPLVTVLVPEDLQTDDARWAWEFENRERVIER